MKIEFKLTGVDGVLRTLQSLPPEVITKKNSPVRLALRKGAVIVRDQAKANVRKIVAEPNKDGRPSESTGELEKAIRVSLAKNGEGRRYIVWTGRVTRKYARTKLNRQLGRVGQTYELEPPQFYGRFLEYGTAKMRPHPWLRPAVASRGLEAINTITREFLTELDRAVKRLAAENSGR